MLNLFRRHIAACSLFGKRTENCPRKPKCPIHFEGIDGTGKYHKPQSLKDPGSGAGIRDWNRAVEVLREMELPVPVEPERKPTVSVEVAGQAFLTYKAKRSDDVRRKTRLVVQRLWLFLEAPPRRKTTVNEITLTDLSDFRATWTDADTTQRRNQEILKSFFKFCLRAEYIHRDPAAGLDPIRVGRPKTEPFTHEELDRIFAAVEQLPDEYGREARALVAQTRAFTLVMRYTAMSIGDTTKLEKADVHGDRIMTYRKKTGEEVFAKVPPFVVEALRDAPHDSERYFFWSGQGKLHTRSSKWGARLQRVFVLAGVRTREVQKRRRAGGKLKSKRETVTVSDATPHMFRHTLVRDLLERGRPMEEIAELLGDSLETVERYYSKWDHRRQARLERGLEEFWALDPITQKLSGVPEGTQGHS